MKRKLAIAWLALTGLVLAFVIIAWLVLPTGEPFWHLAKSITADIALMTPAIRYLRDERERREINRDKERELEEADRRLDEIEKLIRERNER